MKKLGEDRQERRSIVALYSNWIVPDGDLCRLSLRGVLSLVQSRTGASPWIEARPIRCPNSTLIFFRRTATKRVRRVQRHVRVVERYVRNRAWMTMAAGSVTNAWHHDRLHGNTSTYSDDVRRRACQIAGRLCCRKFWWSIMGRNRQAVAGWQTDLALWRGALWNRYRQLQPLSIGWTGVDIEAVRNVLRQSDRIRFRFRARHGESCVSTIMAEKHAQDSYCIATIAWLHCDLSAGGRGSL